MKRENNLGNMGLPFYPFGLVFSPRPPPSPNPGGGDRAGGGDGSGEPAQRHKHAVMLIPLRIDTSTEK